MKNKLKALAFVSAALVCAVTMITPQTAFAEDKTGADYPGEKCQRNEKDGSTTTGQCTNVCKGLTVSGTKDVDSGLRTCEAAARTVTEWGLVAGTGNASVLFWRYNSAGEVQTCGATAKSDEIECRHVTIREVDAKSGRSKK